MHICILKATINLGVAPGLQLQICYPIKNVLKQKNKRYISLSIDDKNIHLSLNITGNSFIFFTTIDLKPEMQYEGRAVFLHVQQKDGILSRKVTFISLN